MAFNAPVSKEKDGKLAQKVYQGLVGFLGQPHIFWDTPTYMRLRWWGLVYILTPALPFNFNT
jgi:hypothetical protein